MDTAQWPQDVGLMKEAMDEHDEVRSGNACNKGIIGIGIGIGGERMMRSRPEEQVKCPRCKSSNTKFCYYNNYSLTQPRYLCKGCRRYWTQGGSLRNVPVGGGSRKNIKRPYNLPHLNPPHQNPNSHQDLNLSFQEPPHDNPSSSSSSALDLMRTGIAGRGLNSFIPMPMPDSNTLQEFKPTQALSFPVGNENNINGGGRLFFPFWDFNKQLAVVDAHQHKGGQGTTNPNTYWNGVLHGVVEDHGNYT